MKGVIIVAGLSFASPAFANGTADLWMAKCKSCHAEDGTAKTQMGKKESIPDLTSPEWQKHTSDADIRRVIAEGSPRNAKMKGFRDQMKPAEIDSMVKYIRAMVRGKK